jgi:NMD protein affecting ribosome stability and mRNA decay
MVRRFCAICGKDLDEGAPHFGMCLSCYLKERPLFELPKRFSFKICIDCGSYSIKEEWFEPEVNELNSIINEAVFRFILKPIARKNEIEFSVFLDEDTFSYSSQDLLKSLDLTVQGALKNNKSIIHEQNLSIMVNHEFCKNCNNLRGGMYFLSIIQLRVNDQEQFDLIKEVIDKVQNLVEKLFDSDHKQYITKIVDEKFGVDLYLSTNELMNYIIKNLRDNYYFLLKRTKKLVGRDSQKGRNIYRLKALIKFLPIAKNEIILLDSDEYVVETIKKNRVILRNKLGAKVIKDYSYFLAKTIKKKKTEELAD